MAKLISTTLAIKLSIDQIGRRLLKNHQETNTIYLTVETKNLAQYVNFLPGFKCTDLASWFSPAHANSWETVRDGKRERCYDFITNAVFR